MALNETMALAFLAYLLVPLVVLFFVWLAGLAFRKKREEPDEGKLPE